MGAVFKKTFTKPLPGNAEIVIRRGERLAAWKDRKGKRKTARVTVPNKGKHAGQTRIVLESSSYTAKYRDGSGCVVEVPTGCRDETAARSVLADLERRAELVKANVLSAAEDAAADHQETPLNAHFADYLDHQTAKDVNPTRIADTRSQLHRIATECGFRRLRDLESLIFERWLIARKQDGMAAGTRNRYRESLIGFANWCVDVGRLLDNPVARVPTADVKAEPSRKRRALTEDELTRLLDAAQRRPVIDRMTIRRGPNKGKPAATLRDETRRKLERLGRERALLYKVFLLTGLRKGELASLTVGQLELDVEFPFVSLNAADEKNGEGNDIALRRDLADDLRLWLKDKLVAMQVDSHGRSMPARLPAETPVFNVPDGLVRILNRDLAFAGIPKIDERGRTIDVHALRHSFGTYLSKSGVPPRTAKLRCGTRSSNLRCRSTPTRSSWTCTGRSNRFQPFHWMALQPRRWQQPEQRAMLRLRERLHQCLHQHLTIRVTSVNP